MDDRFRIAAVGFVASVLFCALAFGAGSGEKVVIREGAAITGMGGELRVVKAEEGYMKFEEMDIWLFKLGEDVNDFRNVLEAGAELQLLPSSALEKLIADFEEHPDSRYRLWGRITKYKDVNYIFADFFLPVVEMGPAEFDEPNDVAEPGELQAKPVAANTVGEANEPEDPNVTQEAVTEAEPNEVGATEKRVESVKPAVRKIEVSELLTDPNGVLEVPKEVLDKLNEKKILLPRKMEPRVKQTPRKFEPREIVLPEKKVKEPDKVEEGPKDDSDSAKKGPEGTVADSAAGDETKVETAEPPEAAERPRLTLDSVLADRTARLVKQEGKLPIFILDALGLRGSEAALEVLPCEVLELTELRLAAALDPMRFKIAGIRTKFKGKEYLLLQKATRSYGHGNFGN